MNLINWNGDGPALARCFHRIPLRVASQEMLLFALRLCLISK